ncbi:MAG: prephenate dehydrogenase [Clostridia bacterium]
MNIGIIGLGLIGGSLAKSIKAQTAHSVVGIDLNNETMTLARLCGAIDGVLDKDTVSGCDLLFLALSPQAAIDWVKDNASEISKTATIIDMCGVKRVVCKELSAVAEENGFAYIGGHPMAGKERGGFVNSSDDLFVGASMILTPDEKTDIATLEQLKAFFTDLGFSNITFTTPEEHDSIIAYTSQLAHITSSAYVKSPTAQMRRGFSAGSFKDMTRVARLDEVMWTELFLDNADHLSHELEGLIEHLNEYLAALKSGDADTLRQLLKDGKEKKATAGGN